VKVMGGKLVADEEYEAYVLLALRSLLGDGKGKMIMKDLRHEDMAAHELIMIEARSRYATLHPEFKENPLAVLSNLHDEGLRLQYRMIEKAKEEGVFDAAADRGDDEVPSL
jgi:hypothetical protein